MAADRDDFTEPNKRLLAERVGFHCSNPACGVVTIWAATNPREIEYVGVAAHIQSASPIKGPRANPKLISQQRSSIDNGIHLCNKCSRAIDNNNGANHSVELLNDWKRQAEDRQRARGFINNNMPVYRSVNYERLDTDYKVALTCAGLNERQIRGCPRDTNLENQIQQQLDIANKCVIIGASGSGKSLLTHQLADVYQARGFGVIQLNKPAYVMVHGIISLPNNTVLIIDDGHTLPEYLIEQLFAQATDTTKILMNWNESAARDISVLNRIPHINIHERRQVELVANYCREHKESIAGYLGQMGVNIDPRDYHRTIDNRIEVASREASPWLFNYNLSEGWRSARQDLELLESRDNSHWVIVVIAVFQIVTLDEGVSWSAVEAALMHYSDDKAWQQSAIIQVKPYVKDDSGLVKLKHYKYAERLLANYFDTLKSKSAHSPTVQLLERLLRDNTYADGHSNLLEFISFDYRSGAYYLSQGSLVADLASESIIPNILPRKVCIRRIYSLVRFNNTQCLSSLAGSNVIEKWIFELEASEAMSFFWMFNDLMQAGYNELTIDHALLSSVYDKLSAASLSSKAALAKVFSLLVSYGGDSGKNIAKELISHNGLDLQLQFGIYDDAHWYFSQTFYNLSWINPDWAKVTFEKNVDVIAHRINNQFFDANSDYNEIIHSFFGVISAILGSDRPYRNKSMGNLLCSKLDPKKIAASLQRVDYHSIQNYWNFLLFVELHNVKLLGNIVNLLDLGILQKLYGNDTTIEHHHRCLLQIIYQSNAAALKEHGKWLIEKLDEYHINILLMFPEDALLGLEAGKRLALDVHTGDECKHYIKIIRALEKESKQELVRRIFCENEKNIIKLIFNNSQNFDRHREKIEYIMLVENHVPHLYERLFENAENIKILFQKIPRLMTGTGIEKLHAKLYIFLIETYSLKEWGEIQDLKKRYRSLRNSRLSDILV